MTRTKSWQSTIILIQFNLLWILLLKQNKQVTVNLIFKVYQKYETLNERQQKSKWNNLDFCKSITIIVNASPFR